MAPREVRERHARRRACRERVAQRLLDHLRVDEVGHQPQRRADDGAAERRVRHGGDPEVARRAAALRPAVRPVERAGGAGHRVGRRPLGTAALRLCVQLHRAHARRHPRRRVGDGRWRSYAADQRARRSSTRAGPRRLTSMDIAEGGRAARMLLLPSGEPHCRSLRRQRVHATPFPEAVKTIGDAIVEEARQPRGSSSPTSRESRTAARRPLAVGVSVDGEDAVRAQCPPHPRRQHHRHRAGGERSRRAPAEPAAGPEGRSSLRSVDLRAHRVSRAQAGGGAGPDPHLARHPPFPAERARHAHRRGRHSRSRSPSRSSCSTRMGRR